MTADRLITEPNRCTPSSVRHRAKRPRGSGSAAEASGRLIRRRKVTPASIASSAWFVLSALSSWTGPPASQAYTSPATPTTSIASVWVR